MLWRLGKIESVIHSTDGNVRGAVVKSGNPTFLRRLIQQLHPLTMTPGDKIYDGVKKLTAASVPADLDAQTVVTLSEGHVPDELLPRQETEYLDVPSVIEIDCLNHPCFLLTHHVYLVVNPH